MRWILILLTGLVAGCAGTQAAQDTARNTSAVLLRVEAQLQAERKALNAALERQREYTRKNQVATQRIAREVASIQREWRISSNETAIQLHANVLESRYVGLPLPELEQLAEFRVDTGGLRNVIQELAAVDKALSDRQELEAFVAFARDVQSAYETLREEAEQQTTDSEADVSAAVAKDAKAEAELLCKLVNNEEECRASSND